MKRLKRVSLWISPFLLLMMALGAWKGCGAQRRPPSLSMEEQDLLRSEPPLNLSVVVEPFSRPVYSNKLFKALSASGAFTNVTMEQPGTRADLVARVEKEIYGRSVIPVLTFASLGFIPTVVSEDHGFVFSLARAESAAPRRVNLSYVHQGATVLGWAAGLLNLTGYWTSQPVVEDELFLQHLRLEIVKAKSDLLAL